MTMKLRDLLKDEQYRTYFRKNQKYPEHVALQEPWKVWAKKTSGAWASKTFATYADAFKLAVKAVKNSDVYEDVSITSRVIGFEPPRALRLAFRDYDWCVLCRRPVTRVIVRKHHALNPIFHQFYAHDPVCPFCGSREDTDVSMVPHPDNSKKKEAV